MLGMGLRVDQNCACVCVSARACMRVRKGLVLRVCLQVSCGAPPRPPALLDPPLAIRPYFIRHSAKSKRLWNSSYTF